MPSDASAQLPDRTISGKASGPLTARQIAHDAAGSDTQRANVLIVEDDPRSARLASAHLQSAGYRVSIAHSAAEAQQSVERAMPDLILCDVCLPDMDGIRLTSWMRSRFAGANLPIALITSSDDQMILSRGLEAGADDFLPKPVNSLELRGRVRSLLRTKVLADELRAREQVALPFGRDHQPEAMADAAATVRTGLPLAVVIEDNPAERRLLEAQLTEVGCRTIGAVSAADGLRLIRTECPDLIVLDLLLPDRSGYEFLASLGSDMRPTRTPVLVVSAMSEVQDRVKALELGADDYIIKGFERSEFEARVRRLLRLKHSLDHLQNRCTQALQLAATDSLTGLYTYGFMQEMLRTQLASAERYGHPYSVILADVDHFKQINDRFGHAAGDLVLRKIAHALHEVVRSADTLVRYGGEEFVALLPHTGREEAMALARRMREAVAGLLIEIEGAPSIPVTMSLGVASYPDDANDPESLLKTSDAAMYRAKKLGRNRVSKASDGAREAGTARILVVDDDERNIRLLEAYLLPEGYEVLQARDGQQAIDICQKQHPDVVVMDALMPNVCGFEACRKMKQDARMQFVPVMLVTSLTARDDHLRGIEAGADEFITKPIDKSQMLMRLQALLRQKRGTDSLEDAEAVVFALARAVEGREPMLADHVERVAHYAVTLGRALGLDQRELEALRRAGIVHDIGKISVPDSILLKPDKLTSEERLIIERHPQTGHDLLRPLRTFSDSLPAVRFHHERLDGSGYPLGLRGDEVPLLAQIVAIADVYDALAEQRHYRGALAPAEAFEILRDEARRGLHDAKLVELFIETLGKTIPGMRTSMPESGRARTEAASHDRAL